MSGAAENAMPYDRKFASRRQRAGTAAQGSQHSPQLFGVFQRIQQAIDHGEEGLREADRSRAVNCEPQCVWPPPSRPYAGGQQTDNVDLTLILSPRLA